MVDNLLWCLLKVDVFHMLKQFMVEIQNNLLICTICWKIEVNIPCIPNSNTVYVRIRLSSSLGWSNNLFMIIVANFPTNNKRCHQTTNAWETSIFLSNIFIATSDIAVSLVVALQFAKKIMYVVVILVLNGNNVVNGHDDYGGTRLHKIASNTIFWII